MTQETYATVQDFIDAYTDQEMIRLTNPYDGSATAIDIEYLKANQLRCFGLINAYVTSNSTYRELLPFSAPYPFLLVNCELELVWSRLIASQNTEEGREVGKQVNERLKMIANGQLQLGLDGRTPSNVIISTNLPKFTKVQRTFTTDSLRGYL